MEIDTKPYGTVEIDSEKIITIQDGLFGFEEHEEYVLLGKEEDEPFEWLQAVNDGSLAFVVMAPRQVRPDYQLNLAPGDAEKLELDKADNLLVYCLVTIPEDPDEMTVNLRGPVVINNETLEGLQVVNQVDEYTVRHNVLEEMRELGEAEQKSETGSAEE